MTPAIANLTLVTEMVETGVVRSFPHCTQAQINRMINYIQRLREDGGLLTHVKVTVIED